ncbi:MAG: glycosyltransferase family 2 protein, partial [bacterium]
VFNGAAFLPELLASLDAQTHTDWRLFVRDDGSSDRTMDIVRDVSARDRRVHVVAADGKRLGATRSFARLLECVPADSAHVMFADQDDVWLPHKIERTLSAMRSAEAAAPGPVLVHTDLSVVDEQLHVVHPSFWEFAGVVAEPVTLRRLVVRNVATGAATMINRALRELVVPLPAEAILHDWWCACTAVALGRMIAVREPTVLYRQHGSNAVGAHAWSISLSQLPRAIFGGLANASELREGIELTAAQARAFLDRYGSRLTEGDRRFLAAYSAIPRRGFLRRKVDLLRFRTLPEYGVLRTLGLLFRG